MIAARTQENGKLSDKEVEGGDSLRTLECLRGRLNAERQSSKLAREKVEILSSKLTELENCMRDEIEMRQKAAKRLKLLTQKLESLNISTPFMNSVNCFLFERSEISKAFASSTCPKMADNDESPSKSTSVSAPDTSSSKTASGKAFVKDNPSAPR